jgi:hypothetical protein
VTAQIPVAQFDPNNFPQGMTLYGVYDGWKFDLTTRRASALQKVHNKSECVLWELTNGVWHRRLHKHTDIHPGMPCGDCGLPLEKYPGVHDRATWARYTSKTEGDWQFTRGHGGKIVDPIEMLFRCDACCYRNMS